VSTNVPAGMTGMPSAAYVGCGNEATETDSLGCNVLCIASRAASNTDAAGCHLFRTGILPVCDRRLKPGFLAQRPETGHPPALFMPRRLA